MPPLPAVAVRAGQAGVCDVHLGVDRAAQGRGGQHRGLANLAAAQIDRFGGGGRGPGAAVRLAGFDASVRELVMALGAGAALVVPGPGSCWPAPELAGWRPGSG